VDRIHHSGKPKGQKPKIQINTSRFEINKPDKGIGQVNLIIKVLKNMKIELK